MLLCSQSIFNVKSSYFWSDSWFLSSRWLTLFLHSIGEEKQQIPLTEGIKKGDSSCSKWNVTRMWHLQYQVYIPDHSHFLVDYSLVKRLLSPNSVPRIVSTEADNSRWNFLTNTVYCGNLCVILFHLQITNSLKGGAVSSLLCVFSIVSYKQ